MNSSMTLTVRVSAQTKKRLGRLAVHVNRSKSHLASEAIADFVDRELAIVEGIKRGLEDVHLGRVVPHKAAMRRLRATVARVAKEKSRRM
jgi:predicted transcriptional regulator